jgi:drug/metabolite transporter (DMT)-like permease
VSETNPTSATSATSTRPLFAGIWFVAFGSALWGTDALFRLPLTVDVASTTIVFAEHLVLVAVTLPWLLPAARKLRGLRLREWCALLFIGAGASAAATAFFTMAFQHGGPITPVALQKLQPILVALAAALLLGERLRPRYGVFLLIALFSAWLLAFSDPLGVTISGLTAALLAIGAIEEGTLRHHMVTHAPGLRDSVYFSIIADEWPQVRRQLEERITRRAAAGG